MKTIKKLEKPVKQILNYTPRIVPKKPNKQPSKAQLEQTYKYNSKHIIEVGQ